MTENNESDQETQDAGKEHGGLGISDDQLPDDLVPSEDNPLAEGLPPGEVADPHLTDTHEDDGEDDGEDGDEDGEEDGEEG